MHPSGHGWGELRHRLRSRTRSHLGTQARLRGEGAHAQERKKQCDRPHDDSTDLTHDF